MQQCRAEGGSRPQDIQEADIKAEVSPFFDDIPARLASAVLVICRSGASTIAELGSLGGRPFSFLSRTPRTITRRRMPKVSAMPVAGGFCNKTG